MSFKQFLIKSEDSYKEEISKTLKKLPSSHSALIKGFKFEFQGGNTLKFDNGHVGSIDVKNKKIIIAAPWSYGREWTLLHELGHLIYANFLNPNLIKEWKKIAKSTKMKKEDRQDPQELFCHAYSSFYAKNSVVKFNFPEWDQFIRNVPS